MTIEMIDVVKIVRLYGTSVVGWMTVEMENQQRKERREERHKSKIASERREQTRSE
jgi:plasmid maintenance system antidote protein VapI